MSREMQIEPTMPKKRFDLEEDGGAQYPDFLLARDAAAARKGLSAKFIPGAQPWTLPSIEEAGEIMPGFDATQWGKYRRDFFATAMQEYPKKKKLDNEEWEAASALNFDLLGDSCQEQCAQLMREVVPFDRFTALANKIERSWMPTGEFRLAELEVKFQKITDASGVVKMFNAFQTNHNSISLIDPTRVKTDIQKKVHMISCLKTQFFAQQVMMFKDDPQWSFSFIENKFRDQIRSNGLLDVNNVPSAMAIPDASEGAAKAAMMAVISDMICYNCGQKGDHPAKFCPSLKCGQPGCGKEWPHISAPGRHTSANCPLRLADLKKKKDKRQGSGGRGGGGRGNGGRNGGGGGKKRDRDDSEDGPVTQEHITSLETKIHKMNNSILELNKRLAKQDAQTNSGL